MAKEYTYEEVVAMTHSNALRGMESACTLLEADTKALTHVVSGNLRRSWTHEVDDKGSEIIGRVGTNLIYAPFENALHPNLSEAVAQDQNQIREIIATALQKIG